MTTVPPPSQDTALTLLFGAGAQGLDTLKDAILTADTGADLDRALKKLPPLSRDAAAREVTAATAELLNINLVDVLIHGWRDYADLTSAARRTLAAPGSTELVNLVSHRVSMSQQPSVNVLVDGHHVATLRLGLFLFFDVSAMLARIRAGLLAAILAGRCDVTVGLTIDDIDVARRQGHLELPGEIAFKKALRLLPAREYPPGEAQAETAGHGAPARLLKQPPSVRYKGSRHPNGPLRLRGPSPCCAGGAPSSAGRPQAV